MRGSLWVNNEKWNYADQENSFNNEPGSSGQWFARRNDLQKEYIQWVHYIEKKIREKELSRNFWGVRVSQQSTVGGCNDYAHIARPSILHLFSQRFFLFVRFVSMFIFASSSLYFLFHLKFQSFFDRVLCVFVRPFEFAFEFLVDCVCGGGIECSPVVPSSSSSLTNGNEWVLKWMQACAQHTIQCRSGIVQAIARTHSTRSLSLSLSVVYCSIKPFGRTVVVFGIFPLSVAFRFSSRFLLWLLLPTSFHCSFIANWLIDLTFFLFACMHREREWFLMIIDCFHVAGECVCFFRIYFVATFLLLFAVCLLDSSFRTKDLLCSRVEKHRDDDDGVRGGGRLWWRWWSQKGKRVPDTR